LKHEFQLLLVDILRFHEGSHLRAALRRRIVAAWQQERGKNGVYLENQETC